MKDSEVFIKIEEILLKNNMPSKELNILRTTDMFKKSEFNVLNGLYDIKQDKKYHPEGNVWNHVALVIDEAARIKELANDKPSFMWGALLHDIGKITNTKWINGRWRSYNHDIAGAEMVKKLLMKVSSKNDFNNRVEEIVRFHMHHIYISKDLPFGNIKGLINTNNINDILLVFICDKLGRGNKANNANNIVVNEVLMILDKIEKESGNDYHNIRINIKSCNVL